MAEGDSIHRLARRLDSRLKNRTVVSSEIRVGQQSSFDLAGMRFDGVQARGKHLLMRLVGNDQKVTIHSHLKMQGRWSTTGPQKRLPSRVQETMRLQLQLDNGETLSALQMPVLDIIDTRSEAEVVGHLGPDLLDPDFDQEAAIHRVLSNGELPAVQALLDQRLMCGIGNLWAIEILFLRGVYPWRPINTVELPPLIELARRMMFYSLDREPGMITTGNKRKGETHWVYGRYNRPCRRCKTPIDFRSGGRGPYDREVWWCPHCQPQPA